MIACAISLAPGVADRMPREAEPTHELSEAGGPVALARQPADRDPEHEAGELGREDQIPGVIEEHVALDQNAGRHRDHGRPNQARQRAKAGLKRVERWKGQIGDQDGGNEPPCRREKGRDPVILRRIEQEDVLEQSRDERLG